MQNIKYGERSNDIYLKRSKESDQVGQAKDFGLNSNNNGKLLKGGQRELIW